MCRRSITTPRRRSRATSARCSVARVRDLPSPPGLVIVAVSGATDRVQARIRPRAGQRDAWSAVRERPVARPTCRDAPASPPAIETPSEGDSRRYSPAARQKHASSALGRRRGGACSARPPGGASVRRTRLVAMKNARLSRWSHPPARGDVARSSATPAELDPSVCPLTSTRRRFFPGVPGCTSSTRAHSRRLACRIRDGARSGAFAWDFCSVATPAACSPPLSDLHHAVKRSSRWNPHPWPSACRTRPLRTS